MDDTTLRDLAREYLNPRTGGERLTVVIEELRQHGVNPADEASVISLAGSDFDPVHTVPPPPSLPLRAVLRFYARFAIIAIVITCGAYLWGCLLPPEIFGKYTRPVTRWNIVVTGLSSANLAMLGLCFYCVYRSKNRCRRSWAWRGVQVVILIFTIATLLLVAFHLGRESLDFAATPPMFSMASGLSSTLFVACATRVIYRAQLQIAEPTWPNLSPK
jgi:hypothetical protein